MATTTRFTRRTLAALAASALAGSASAQLINLYGDIGTQFTTGAPFSPINTTLTTPFSWSNANGSITGDVIVANDPTGTIFDLTITNLTYTCITPNTSGFGDVILQVQHAYATSGTGTYFGQHSLAGSWTSGPNSIVQLDNIQDFGNSNVSLPSLIATTSPFNLGPVTGFALTTSPVYSVQATLRLRSDGVGAISLPSSAHFRASLVPAPGSIALLGLGSLLAARRRR
jgi:hypothetical protein